jgi:uncharacterized membrane protein YgcG
MMKCKQHGTLHMLNGVCHGTHMLPHGHLFEDEDDTRTDLTTALPLAVLAMETLFDSSPSIDTSVSTDTESSFGGFDGGSSGGGGSDSSW